MGWRRAPHRESSWKGEVSLGHFHGEVGTMSEIQQRHWRRGLEEGERAESCEAENILDILMTH